MAYASWIPAACAADSSLLGLAPADSDALIGINLKQIRESDLGERTLAEVGPDNPGYKEFATTACFDPFRDPDEVLIAAPATQHPKAPMMLRGSFDAAKLAQLAADGGMVPADCHGVQILSRAAHQEGFSALAIIDRALVVRGNQAGVQAFVDRRGQTAVLKVGLAAKPADAFKANDIWVVLQAAPAAFAPESATSGHMGPLLQSIEQASLGLKVGSDVVLFVNVVTHTPQAAEGLAAALRVFSWMAGAKQKDNKQVAAPAPSPAPQA